MRIERVIISGGGTGGHIFPALAIANEIKARSQDAKILFVGALGRMEMEKVPAAGYKITGLPVTGLPRKPGLKMIPFLTGLLKSISRAKKIIRDFQPQVVIGVGGFASGPLLRAASRKRIPTLIQEQNSYAGITNKLLGKKAGAICVAYEKMDRWFPEKKIVLTGNPVREDLTAPPGSQKEARAFFGLEETKKVILILGGSLGARSINNAMLKNAEKVRTGGVQVLWQTGSLYYREMREKMKDKTPAGLKLVEFISRMDLAYAAADVIVTRAGAGTISELCIIGKPAVFVPSPNVAEDHQTKNAAALVDKDAARMVSDREADDRLLDEAIRLIQTPGECTRLSGNIKKLARPGATRHIVDEAEKLLKK